MNLKCISIREVGYREWLKDRLAKGVGFQGRFEYPQRKIAYGSVVDALEYDSFPQMIEDIGPEDKWLYEMRVWPMSVEIPLEYSASRLFSLLNGTQRERSRLMEGLENADKISMAIRPKTTRKPVDHFYFRRNGHVYSDTIRITPECLDEFSSWGFRDPHVFFVKSDFFVHDKKMKGSN